MMGFSKSFWLATLTSVFYSFSIQMTFPLVPVFITDEMHASESLVGTAVLVTAIIGLVVRIPAGSWSDRYGRRMFMLIGAGMGILYPVSMALSTTVNTFMISRVVFGFALAFLTTANRAYIADIVPSERRGEAFGWNSSAFSLALILGPLAGEAIRGEFGFRPAFWAGAVMAFAALITVIFLEDHIPEVRLDSSMFGDLGAVLKLRGAWASMITSVAASGVFAMILVFFPVYAQGREFAADAPQLIQNVVVSLSFSLWAVVTLFGLPRAGRFSDLRGRTRGLIPGVIICLPGIILLARAGNLWIAYLAIIVLGIGFSFMRSIMDALMQDACPRELRGTGAAVLFATWDIAIGVESQVLGMAIDLSGFDLMYGIVAATLVFGGVMAIRLSYQVSWERMTTYKQEFPVFPPA